VLYLKQHILQATFVLAELNGSIKGQSQITVAGWDNRNITPTSTTIIHHPIGDAKITLILTLPNNQQLKEDNVGGYKLIWEQQITYLRVHHISIKIKE
jgi:hypothetical protein